MESTFTVTKRTEQRTGKYSIELTPKRPPLGMAHMDETPYAIHPVTIHGISPAEAKGFKVGKDVTFNISLTC